MAEGKDSSMRLWIGRVATVVGVAALVLFAGLGGSCLARWMREQPTSVSASAEPWGKLAANLEGWGKPDLTLVLTGEQHGYILPCGCSRPQVGGLERRQNFLKVLRSRGWPVAALDVGDIPQKGGPVNLGNEQGLIKYRYSMAALKEMGFNAVGFGAYEAGMGLFKVLGEYALNEPKPRVLSANLKDAADLYPEQTAPWEKVVVEGQPWKVGVTSVTGPKVAGAIQDKQVRFTPAADALKKVSAEMDAAGVELRVLLYQGYYTKAAPGQEPREVEALAKAFPGFQVILALSEEDEPSSQPVRIAQPGGGETVVVRVGHKGKHLGVLGLWKGKTPTQPTSKYALVQMSEDYLTPEGQEAENPVALLMERYTRELERDKYLERHPQVNHPFQAAEPESTPRYVGSDKCERCHQSAYKTWKESGHSHAYQTLVDAKNPSRRQFDPECIVCHTVGYGYKGGFLSQEKSANLVNVGCESCHGPGSEHLKNTGDATWHALMNPWKAKEGETADQKKARTLKADQFCQTCHDMDNDVTWTNDGFARKWPKVAHPTPEAEKNR